MLPTRIQPEADYSRERDEWKLFDCIFSLSTGHLDSHPLIVTPNTLVGFWQLYGHQVFDLLRLARCLNIGAQTRIVLLLCGSIVRASLNSADPAGRINSARHPIFNPCV
ncbi:hypothetical protein [Neotabrizicola shimadae]|uniref:Uncharacterized protein n=1 Tax=Neotabrizicola shimadae TaxID=2807096 RepID=A0A8G0ZVI2_9RHOB|nr:hypothetical protein [Neotabrizicola shimadae]QYZ70938.1 hypothetical protein JO391_05345 [Neotabrizicola shimadae]